MSHKKLGVMNVNKGQNKRQNRNSDRGIIHNDKGVNSSRRQNK